MRASQTDATTLALMMNSRNIFTVYICDRSVLYSIKNLSLPQTNTNTREIDISMEKERVRQRKGQAEKEIEEREINNLFRNVIYMKNMFDLYGCESLPPCRRNCQLKPRNDYENKSTKSLICKKIIYRKTCYKQKREREKKREPWSDQYMYIYIRIYILNICINCSATYDFFFCMDYIVHIRNICMCVSVDCELMPAIFICYLLYI